MKSATAAPRSGWTRTYRRARLVFSDPGQPSQQSTLERASIKGRAGSDVRVRQKESSPRDDETVPEQHRDRGGVVIGGPRPQPGQAVLSTGELTDLADGLGGQSAAGELLPDPVAELSFAIGNADQVDPEPAIVPSSVVRT
jgi:hypothetical protein